MVELYHEFENGELEFKGEIETADFHDFKEKFMAEFWPKYPLPSGSKWLFRYVEKNIRAI